MIKWELHDSLARSIGDPLIKDDGLSYAQGDAIAGIPIPDGVRYTTAIRDHYLNKAMLAIQRDIMNQVASLSRYRASIILQRIFPSMTKQYSVNISGMGVQPADQLHIYNVWLYSANMFPAGERLRANALNNAVDGRTVRNVPVIDLSTMSHINASPGNIKPDLVGYTTSLQGVEWLGLSGTEVDDMVFQDQTATLPEDEITLVVNYYPTAPDVSKIASIDNIDFEHTWSGNLLSRAIMYAHQDSGELGASYQSVPFIESIRTGVQNEPS